MTCWDAFVEKLFSYHNRRSKDLAPVLELDRRLGSPHRFFRSVHVGGTNGKGSVSLKIAKALEAEGYKVGLYTSPHVTDVRERIEINGERISAKDMQRLIEPLFSYDLPLSFFDFATAAAFLYFKEKQVDWAVVEVGLGGRFDATNVIEPQIAAITSIGYDHVHLLGGTLEEIAWEKGGIAKTGIPLVTGPSAARFFPGSIAVANAPFYDLENQGVARAVLEKLSISESSIQKGIGKRPSCRFERKGNLILDVAHNPDGFQKLIEALQIHFPDIPKFPFVVGFSKDKDWKACLDLLAPIASSITALRVQKERLELPEKLREYNPSIRIAESMQSALKPEAVNVVCGSFYLMDEAIFYNRPIATGK